MPAAERRPRWLAPMGVAISIIFFAGLFAAAWRALDDGPSHPDAWDPRVADLAAFVEDERGHDFDHAVYVDFLSPEEYSAAATEDGGNEAEARAEFDDYAAQLRALGAASGELDLYEAYSSITDSGTLAFYDPTDERISVRGTRMTVGLEVTLVHELTHALQDQHFDLDRLYDPSLDSDASTAFRALGEGDAVRVEEAYIAEELSVSEKAAYDKEYAGELADSKAATADVPPFLSAQFTAPYALGQPFVTLLFNQDGNDAVDRAFREPPHTQEHLFDPASFVAGEGSSDVELDLDDDLEVLEEGPFGATTWYLMLAERIDPKQAFEAALGWDGDAFAAYREDGEVCVQAVFAGDDESDEAQMATALEAWVAAMPGGAAEVIDAGGHPGFKTCDPGESVDLKLTGRSENSLYLPNLWGYLVASAAQQLTAEESRCFARTIVKDLTFEEITDPKGAAFTGPAWDEALRSARETCST